jgi:undecaprenyl-diphosphatase
MPDWLAVVILGVIEGITEFLPISSTGHLLLADYWIQYHASDLFLAVIQTGAVLAVIMAFAERLKMMLRNIREPETKDFIVKLAAAFCLTAIGGLLLKKTGFQLEKNPGPIAWATLIGGILILLVERHLKGKELSGRVTWAIAIAVGVGQLIAVIFPGSSRSGTTILMALVLGCSRQTAIEFSFLLGIPTLFAAAGLEILSAVKHGEVASTESGLVLLGAAVAALTAFASVRWLLRYIQGHSFSAFGWYRIALGLMILAVF